MELIQEIEKFIIDNNLINKNDKIVVGVSGGPDSLCLLYVLNELKIKYDLSLIVVHVNHMIRQEADYEEKFVEQTANTLNLPFFSKKIDIINEAKINKQSTEEYARNVRYNFFEEIRKREGANKIAVAHNLNDTVETTLMNIIRGCGIEGLCGITAFSGVIIRPLLNTSREKIEKYCLDNKLTPMIDKTNLETVYTRNKIRKIVLPSLKGINPDIINSISRMNNILKEEKELIDEIVEKEYSEVRLKCEKLVLNKERFNLTSESLKRRILRKAIYEFRNSLKDISFVSIENAIDIIKEAQNGNIIKISDDVKIIVNYNKLNFVKSIDKIEKFVYELNVPGRTYIDELGTYIDCEIKNADEVPDTIKDKNEKIFDIEKTGKKLYVRNRKDGDTFFPTGMTGSKKIKDFLSDNKISTDERDKIPLITSNDEIIWVVGLRSSRKFLKDKQTKEVIILKYGKNI